MPCTATLTLNLSRNGVGDNGVQALAELKNAAALHTLTLNLGGKWETVEHKPLER